MHLDDPQVAAAVYRLLYETGVISPERVGGPPTSPSSCRAAGSGAGRSRIGPGTAGSRQPHLDAGQRSSGERRQEVDSLDAVLIGGGRFS